MPSRIVFRGDDAGSCESANLAIAQCAREGVLRNVSVMAPGLAFDHAVPILKTLEGIALGLHVTLNAEWDQVKWGPVLPASEVPSLVEPDGVFTEEPRVLHERGFSVREAMAEIAAQLDRCRAAGLEISYLDEHMGVGWIEGLAPELRDFCRREGLVDHRLVPYWSQGAVETPDRFLGIEGPLAFVTHPGLDAPDMREFTRGGVAWGEVARERDGDRRLLTDARLGDLVRSAEIVSITYPEAVDARA